MIDKLRLQKKSLSYIRHGEEEVYETAILNISVCFKNPPISYLQTVGREHIDS